MNEQHRNLGETYDRALQDPKLDHKWNTYWEDYGDTPIKTLIRMASNSFSKDSPIAVADLGCGTGRDLLAFLKLFSDAGFLHTKFVGCEISCVGLSRCREHGLAVEQADMESFLNACQEPLSILWAHYSLIHLTDDAIGPAIACLANKVARPGILGIGFKAGDGSRWSDPGYGATRETTYFSFDAMADLVRGNGLTVGASILTPATARPVPHQYAWIIASKL